jgi:hypothetical protein
MKHSRYPVETSDDSRTNDNYHMYEFYSEGSRGRIKKVILYEKIGNNLFNLGFGDWNEELQRLDDSSRSNNGDRGKVLATVAYTALEFTSKFPHALIFAEGRALGTLSARHEL